MSRCRSCQAPIEWALTEKGKRIPLDASLVPAGNMILGDDGIARVVAPGAGDRTSHFATCPDAKSHRKRDRRRG